MTRTGQDASGDREVSDATARGQLSDSTLAGSEAQIAYEADPYLRDLLAGAAVSATIRRTRTRM